MTAIAVVPQQQAIAERPAYADVMRPRTLTEAMELADKLARSSFVPQAFRGNSGDILAAIAYGAEVGLAPLASLQSVAVVNGKPCLYGDALLAVCQAHPAFEWIKETIEGSGDQMIAVCIVKRRGMEQHESRFSVADAKRAGLWGKKGPWQEYTPRMMAMRARGFGLRNTFADALKGLISREEAEDYPAREPMRAEVVTASPQASTPAKSAVEATKAKLAAKQTKRVVSFESVMTAIRDAKSFDDLKAAARNINSIESPDDREVAKSACEDRRIEMLEPPHNKHGEVIGDGDGGDNTDPAEEREPGSD